MSTRECDCDVHPVAVKADPVAPWRAQARIAIRGMHCRSCAERVRAALRALDGVSGAAVGLGTGVARVRYDPRRVTERQLLDAVAHASDGTSHLYGGTALR